MNPSLMRNPPARAIASRSGVVGNVFEHVPCVIRREWGRTRIRGRSPGGGSGSHAFLAFDAQTDQGTDLAAELDRLVLGQVAEVLHLHVPIGVLVNGQRVDHAYRVGFA
jgi:hypothetical protein